jgi:hypothetical protein
VTGVLARVTFLPSGQHSRYQLKRQLHVGLHLHRTSGCVFDPNIERSKLRSGLKTRARIVFPWFSTSKSKKTNPLAKKNPYPYTIRSTPGPTSRPSLEQSAMPQQSTKLQPPAIPQQSAIHPLDNFLHDLRPKKEANRYNAEPVLPGPACNCVLGTVELLESILSSLPIRNLFVLQLVSRTWKQTIVQSTSIQAKMSLHCSPRQRDIWETSLVGVRRRLALHRQALGYGTGDYGRIAVQSDMRLVERRGDETRHQRVSTISAYRRSAALCAWKGGTRCYGRQQSDGSLMQRPKRAYDCR